MVVRMRSASARIFSTTNARAYRLQEANMRKRSVRRKFSFALPAFVFLSLALAEKVEVRAVADTPLSLSQADENLPHIEPAHRTGSPRGCQEGRSLCWPVAGTTIRPAMTEMCARHASHYGRLRVAFQSAQLCAKFGCAAAGEAMAQPTPGSQHKKGNA